MATIVWKEAKKSFGRSLKYCENALHETDCSLIRLDCQKAGKEFFKMLSDGENLFDVGDEFKKKPIAKDVPPNGNPREHYAEYWLCVLGFLARAGQIAVGNSKLTRTQLPSSWAAIYYESRVAEQFFIDHRAYICEVCNGSVQTCEKILSKRSDTEWWKPPKDHISTKEIAEKYKISGTTLAGWRRKDKIDVVRHPITGLIYHPKNWLTKRLESYTPKPKK